MNIIFDLIGIINYLLMLYLIGVNIDWEALCVIFYK
jgi:hypothetical protein